MKIYSEKEKEIIKRKLKKIIGPKKNRIFYEKDIEMDNARIKNIAQAVSAYGARPQNFIGMLTLTIEGDENRISISDNNDKIIRKTKIAYDSIIYYVDKFRRFLKKKGFKFIYILTFELQKDGNLHAHIYFSVSLKAFWYFFIFYHNFKKSFTTPKFLNNGKKKIIPLGRSQLGISKEFMKKLTDAGYEFEIYCNPKKPDRLDWRCLNFVSCNEFKSGDWPTLHFYSNKNLARLYSKKIVKYLTKNYKKVTAQKVIGSEFVKHNTKNCYESSEWSEVQKNFIRKVCGKVYTHSKLPIHVNKYQKHRKSIMKIYSPYKNLNTLIMDILEGKASYKNNILTCPNGKKIQLI